MEARKLNQGYNLLTDQNGLHREMLMDIGVQVFAPGEHIDFNDAVNETAFLLLDGQITFAWNGQEEKAERYSLFNEKPACLHVPAGTAVTITAGSAAEVLIQKTLNPAQFEPVYYTPKDIKDVFLGTDTMQGCAKRILRDIFNYKNAPYSNMVIGEDIHLPGRWSSYPPHHHPQPEVYYYRFDKPQGFGVSIIGDEPILIMDNSISVIPGGLCHPQVCAPGYAMFYVWMIRHFENNPWVDRIDDPAHTWLHDKNADIWDGPKQAQ